MEVYESIFKENKEGSFKFWINYLQNAPFELIIDTVKYWRNKKFLWNNKNITLSKSDIDTIVNLQKAIEKLNMKDLSIAMRDMKAASIDTGESIIN